MPTSWVFDTSSLIEIVRRDRMSRSQREQALAGLATLASAGRLKAPPECHAELARYLVTPNEALDWYQKHRSSCENRASFEQVAIVLASVREILDEQKDSGVDEADPYVLALALDLRSVGHDVRVVTEERRGAVRKMSLASAAGYLGLPAVDVRTMLKFEGILHFGPV